MILRILQSVGFACVLILSLGGTAQGDITDWTIVDNVGNSVTWVTIAQSGELGNWTGGGGEAATASSDLFGPTPFDTELISPVVDLSGVTNATLSFLINYQNFLNAPPSDFMDTDISFDDGANWANLLNWTEDHGDFRSTPGELVNVPILGGSATTRIRFRYYDLSFDAWGWYAQVDDVLITNDANGQTVFFENFVPEPSNFGLLLLSSIALIGRRRRRR